MNLRAVVGDARGEIAGFGDISAGIHTSAENLAERTATCRPAWRKAASMERRLPTIQQSAQTAQELCMSERALRWRTLARRRWSTSRR